MDLNKDGLPPTVHPVLPPGQTDWTVRNTGKSTGGGIAGMSLPLLLEIVATDRSQVDNEGAVRNIRTVGGHKKRELQ